MFNYKMLKESLSRIPPVPNTAIIAGIHNDGISLYFPGDLQPSQKHYRGLEGVMYKVGQTVQIKKISGTYLVMNTLKGIYRGGLDDFTSILLHFDDSLQDGSFNPKALTMYSGPAVYASGKFGKAINLNGSTQFATIPDGPDTTLSNDEWTIDFWAYLNKAAYDSSYQYLYSKRVYVDDTHGTGIVIGVTNVGTLYAAANDTASGTTFAFNVNKSSFPLKTWTHIAVERDNAGSVSAISMFLNGVKVSSATCPLSSVVYNPAGASVRVGCTNYPWQSGNPAWGFWPGMIDEFRLSSTARYRGSDFTPPVEQYTTN